jgi:hypothetical protein
MLGGINLTINTAVLLIVCIVLFISIAMVLHRTNPKCRYLSTSVLLFLLFSIISTISLGVNYIAAFTGNLDGIGLTSQLAKLIIGESRWNLELFLGYFEAFTTLSLMLLFIYFIALLYENKKQYKA